MKPYADTNYFTALFCGGVHQAEALRWSGELKQDGSNALPVTFLARMEVINAIHQQVFFTRNGLPGLHASPEMALVEQSSFMEELGKSQGMRMVTLNVEELVSKVADLVLRHTEKHGFRTYDMIHVASALLLGCDAFWTFDMKARKLAKLEGLSV